MTSTCGTVKMWEDIKQPQKLPDSTHEVIVDLENVHLGLPDFDLAPKTHELIVYKFLTAKDDIPERLKGASIALMCTCPINAVTLGKAPYM